MKRLFEKLITPVTQSSKASDIILALPRILCGLLLAFDFGASKFGMPWTSSESNLSLFQVSDWFVEDIAQYGGLFALSPLLFAWLGAASEALGGLFLAFGLKTRIASFFLTCTMLVAIFFQKWDQGIWGMLPAMGFLWVSLYHIVLGSGRFGLDYLIGKRLEEHRILSTPIIELKQMHKPSKLGTKSKIAGMFILFAIFSAQAQSQQVTFKVDMGNVATIKNVAIQGSESPLSWDKTTMLSDMDNDGIYELTIDFNTSKKNVKFKFVNDGKQELQGADKRVIWFKNEPVVANFTFNEFQFYKKEQLQKLVYSEAQIKEDVSVLKEVLQYIHPNIFKYRDSLSLQEDFQELEAQMIGNPTLENAYKQVSKFAAKVRCSHTFTNPWNQSSTTEKAIFHQPNKIPFTFSRLGKKIFVDKNASDNDALKKGMEIKSINGATTEEIMTRLVQYTTSDGNNYEKKLERLLTDGTEKFSMFDIFYPLEFGNAEQFELELEEPNKKESVQISVKAISKTNRTQILEDRYGKLESSVKEGWNFKILNTNTAQLILKSFAVQRNEFDWKAFLDNAFEKVSKKGITNLIIDIRGNEGGQGEVGEYILERLVRTPVELPAMISSVRYKTIPESFKKYINTWDKFPYDFTKKIASETDGRYFLKDKYSVARRTYKPRKDAFKGQVYLIIDASNSSATHLMAMYAKKIENITLVGQETGGNQKGTNGSFMFFLRLPNTKVELDIPVIGMQVEQDAKEIYDGGVIPDLRVEKNAMDYANGIDTELNTILELITKK
ncbi:S41 family peptidase [Maribacter sp. IgM3_T14_3]|uniref:S41 family peptidase n=1 Tax=Maribacter sp. IgM3_T14_3 TaxID=3415140 RepID=UPI003C6ECDCA